MRGVMGLAAAVVLAGCATVEVTQSPIAVTPTEPGARGLDVYADARVRGLSAPRFRGQEVVTVRTAEPLAQGGAEIADARCTLESGLFEAAFVTPARVLVPDYGPSSLDLFIRCEKDGRRGSVTAEPFNATLEEEGETRTTIGIGSSLSESERVAVEFVLGPARDPENDDYQYGTVRVTLR